jgi:hypothetical protein
MSEYRFNLIPPPVDTITGKDILEMLNAPTQYDEFKQFAESGMLCSPSHNPAFRGRGKNDEWGNLINSIPFQDRKQNHPRLEIGNYFLMMAGDSNINSRIVPSKKTTLWLCQVYEAIGFSNSIKFKGRGIRYKYYQMGHLDWSNAEGFALSKEKVFKVSDSSMHQNNGGTWSGNILHFHIFGDNIDFDFINWPNENPQGLIWWQEFLKN